MIISSLLSVECGVPLVDVVVTVMSPFGLKVLVRFDDDQRSHIGVRHIDGRVDTRLVTQLIASRVNSSVWRDVRSGTADVRVVTVTVPVTAGYAQW